MIIVKYYLRCHLGEHKMMILCRCHLLSLHLQITITNRMVPSDKFMEKKPKPRPDAPTLYIIIETYDIIFKVNFH